MVKVHDVRYWDSKHTLRTRVYLSTSSEYGYTVMKEAGGWWSIAKVRFTEHKCWAPAGDWYHMWTSAGKATMKACALAGDPKAMRRLEDAKALAAL